MTFLCMRYPRQMILALIVFAVMLVTLALNPSFARAQSADDAAAGDPAAAASDDAVVAEEDPMQFVTVDWGEEMIQGGVTMIALALLSVLLIAFAVERMIVLRRKRFVPSKLTDEVRPLFIAGKYDAVLDKCRKSNSTLGRVVAYLTEHRDAEPMMLAQSAGDLGARELADQEARNVPFAVVAALAPLLGLLGTMIGMIEAFKLVEVFGDEGGASMLAGSISKALITTAAGLILAIPAITLYHIFKHRLHQMTQALEAEVESLFSAWFVLPQDAPPARSAAARPVRQVAGNTAAPTPSKTAAPAPASSTTPASATPRGAAPTVTPSKPAS